VALAAEVEVAPETLAYLNRLSDFLFVAARIANQRAHREETEWNPPRGAA
jgi:cob(I)alamin adenosyltransferase